jgi:hypothetical protein
MTMKPPSGLAAESESEGNEVDPEDLSDEVAVDTSDDVTVEASEDVTVESVTRTNLAEETPPPLSSLASSAVGGGGTPLPVSSSVLSVLSPSLPLPGVTAAPPPREVDEADDRAIDEDVTTLARGLNEDVTRPAITDDDEEETKVEPAETAIRAAASRDEVATALSEQASLEREKALRKSGLGFEVPAPRGGAEVEFADPGDDDDDEGAVISSADAISADPIDDDDDIDDQEVEPVAASAEDELDDGSDDDATAMFAKATDSSPLAAALTARRPGSPPTGSPFGSSFGSARLPSPTGAYGALSLSTPAVAAQAPAPANSPFGKLAAVPAGSPFGARTTTASLPALQIPAPSGAAAPTTEGGTGLFKRIELPLGGLIASWALCAVVGIIFGAKVFGGGAPAPATVVTARPAPSAPAPTTGPVVQPVAPSAPGESPTPIPAATGAVPTPTPAAKKPGPAAGEDNGAEAPEGEAAGEPMPAPKAVKKVARPRKPALTLPDEEGAPAPKAARPAAPAAKPAAKPAKSAKKAWVDPFAQ